jgi:hypothetical protein
VFRDEFLYALASVLGLLLIEIDTLSVFVLAIKSTRLNKCLEARAVGLALLLVLSGFVRFRLGRFRLFGCRVLRLLPGGHSFGLTLNTLLERVRIRAPIGHRHELFIMSV